MANIRIDVDGILMDGHEVSFKAPCDCTAIEALNVYYLENGQQKNKIFVMKDTHGNNLAGLGNLFTKGAYVKVILNTVDGIAYLQNGDTNGYLEQRFSDMGSSSFVTTMDTTLSDSADGGIKILNVYGKSEQGENPSPENVQPIVSAGQRMAEGNQLFNKEVETLNTFISSNVTVGNSVKPSTSTASITYKKCAYVEAGKTYTISYNYESCSATNARFGCICDENDIVLQNNVELWNKSDKSRRFTANESGWLWASIDILSTDIMLVEGTTALPWEPYTGGVKKAVDVGIQKKVTGERVSGENMLKIDATSKTINGITFDVQPDGSIIVNGTASEKAHFSVSGTNTKQFELKDNCILSGCPKGNKQWNLCIFYYDTSVNWVQLALDTGDGCAIDTSKYKTGYCELTVEKGAVCNNLVFKPMINNVEITEQTLTLNRVLRGIPVTDSSLATYTDENGQMWCADYVDVERKVLVQNIAYITLDGSSDEAWSTSTYSTYRFMYDKSDIKLGGLLLSTQSVGKTTSTDATNESYVSGSANRLVFNTPCGSLSDWKTHLAENPMGVQYILATPIETPLTDEEIVALHSLKSCNGVTRITSDNVPDAPMLVKYGTSEVGALTIENSNLQVVNGMLVDEIDKALPYSIVIDDEAETINFIDREVGSIGTGGGASTFTGFAGAGFHNSIYRGQYLGNAVTDAQYKAIADGTFDDLYIGDYWTINGVNWRIASFDYYLRTGDTECTTHHVVIVPDTNLYEHVINDSKTTNGGYAGSKMYTEGLDQAKTAIKSAFSGHVLSHKIYLTNEVSGGKPSGGAWYDSEVALMCEQMVYGSGIFSPVSDGANSPANYRVEKSQLPLFQHDSSRITNRTTYWLRDVITGTNFACVNAMGFAAHNGASVYYGVRPAFCIKG